MEYRKYRWRNSTSVFSIWSLSVPAPLGVAGWQHIMHAGTRGRLEDSRRADGGKKPLGAGHRGAGSRCQCHWRLMSPAVETQPLSLCLPCSTAALQHCQCLMLVILPFVTKSTLHCWWAAPTSSTLHPSSLFEPSVGELGQETVQLESKLNSLRF